jgi:hypothetical protein
MDSIGNQLRILQRILVISRSLALHGADAQQLAGILDETEYLVALIRYGEEEEGEFRDHLCRLGDQFPEFVGIMAEYEDPLNIVEYTDKSAEAA